MTLKASCRMTAQRGMYVEVQLALQICRTASITAINLERVVAHIARYLQNGVYKRMTFSWMLLLPEL